LNDPAKLEAFWKSFGYRKYRYYASNPHDPLLPEIDTVTKLLLQKLQTLTRENHVTFCAALLPAEENLWPEHWPEKVKLYPGLEQVSLDFDKPFAKTKEFLPELFQNGALLDLRPPLKKLAAHETIFFRYDFHYNAQGHAGVAQALQDWLEPKILNATSNQL